MWNEQTVNVRARASHAAARNGGTGRLEELEGKRGEPVQPEPWWKRYFKWEENLTVAGRTIEKGFVITPAMTLLLVGAFLGVLGYGYKATTADSRETRDSIVRMETMLNERTRNFERQQDKMEMTLTNEVKLAEMRREEEAKKETRLFAALRAKGIIIEDD